jgi:hypothetical protein
MTGIITGGQSIPCPPRHRFEMEVRGNAPGSGRPDVPDHIANTHRIAFGNRRLAETKIA